MVYCSKCGTLNSEDANVCTKCGASLQPSAAPEWGPQWRHRRYEGEYHYRHEGAGMGALIFGVIIILVGLSFLLSEVYGISLPWWPIILIIIGLWVLFAGLRRSRRASRPQPQ